MLFFFFSSRRRHTRSDRDWSSDVCSSDLVLERELACSLTPPIVVVTLHPTTLGGDPRSEVEAVAGAMEAVPAAYIVTQANADTGGAGIRDYWRQGVHGRHKVGLAGGLGAGRYLGLLPPA